MCNVTSLEQQHKHTARLMAKVYEYIEERFGDSDYGINVEYDLAIKVLARVGYNLASDTFKDDVLHDINEMMISFGKYEERE